MRLMHGIDQFLCTGDGEIRSIITGIDAEDGVVITVYPVNVLAVFADQTEEEIFSVVEGGDIQRISIIFLREIVNCFFGFYMDILFVKSALKSGVPNAIRVFNEVLKPKGITKCGIRLDSGDMAYLTQKARQMLDEAGWTECQISVSNSLDEYIIQDLLRQGAKIDMFGVGERLITARSEPVFGGVYKLAAVENEDGTITPKIKISENVGKITNPHFKKLYRFYGNDTGKAIADYLCIHDEVVDDSKDMEIFDPEATWKTKTVYNFTAKELQVPIFVNGELVYKCPSLQEVRAYCMEQVDTLWDEVKRFDNPHTYYVDLSQKLWDIKYNLLKNNGKK